MLIERYIMSLSEMTTAEAVGMTMDTPAARGPLFTDVHDNCVPPDHVRNALIRAYHVARAARLAALDADQERAS